MEETRREYWAEYLVIAASVIPAMITCDIFRSWNVLPRSAWFAIATAGAAVGGALATPLWVRGLVSGGATGAGIFGGILLYVFTRTHFLGHSAIWKAEVVVGALLGYAPGALLYRYWARPRGTSHE